MQPIEKHEVPCSGGALAPRPGVRIRGPLITDTPWKVSFARPGRGRRRVGNLI